MIICVFSVLTFGLHFYNIGSIHLNLFCKPKQENAINKQVAQEDNKRSPEEQLAQCINIIRNSKRPLVELLKLLELELKPKPVST